MFNQQIHIYIYHYIYIYIPHEVCQHVSMCMHATRWKILDINRQALYESVKHESMKLLVTAGIKNDRSPTTLFGDLSSSWLFSSMHIWQECSKNSFSFWTSLQTLFILYNISSLNTTMATNCPPIPNLCPGWEALRPLILTWFGLERGGLNIPLLLTDLMVSSVHEKP